MLVTLHSRDGMLDASQRLRSAIVAGNLSIAKRLLARYPELWLNTDPENRGWCNLHYALYNGNYLVCFHLVSLMARRARAAGERICDIDLVTFDNLSVLHMPLEHHHLQTLHYLLQEFPLRWVNHAGGRLRRTPLHCCCVHRFADGLKLLLEFGADWRQQDANGDTCLHLCFAYGDMACLRELVTFVALQALQGEKNKGRAEAESQLQAFEGTTNNRGWRAAEYALLFELLKRYTRLREQWVLAALEMAQLSVWDDVPFAVSRTGTKASVSSGSSLEPPNEASVLTSPMYLIQRMSLDSVGKDKERRFRPQPPPLRTPTMAPGAMPSPKTPTAEFPRISSLKLVTISPLVRLKRHDEKLPLNLRRRSMLASHDDKNRARGSPAREASLRHNALTPAMHALLSDSLNRPAAVPEEVPMHTFVLDHTLTRSSTMSSVDTQDVSSIVFASVGARRGSETQL